MIFSALARLFGGKKDQQASSTIGQPGDGRRNPSKDAEYTGQKAITREEYARRQAEAAVAGTNPPKTAELASANTAQALAAGIKQRKRAAAGGSLLTGAPGGQGGPGGSFAAKTLLGS